MSTLKSLSKFFVYLAVLSPIIVAKELYFPFITGKALFFRFAVEAALFLYLLYVLFLKEPLRSKEFGEIKETLKHPVFIATAIFAAIFVLSSLLSVNSSFSFWSNFERSEGGFQMLHYFGFFALLAVLFRTKSDWLGIFKFNLAAAVFASLYAVAQISNYYEWIHWDWTIFGGPRPGGALGNPAYLGGYSLLALLSGLFLFRNAETKTRKIIIGGIMAFLFLMIFVSNTRGALIAMGVGIFILLSYLAFVSFRTKPITGNLPLMGLTTFLIFAVIFLATPQLTIWKEIPGLQRLTVQSMFGGTSLSTRIWTWGSAMSAIIEKPVLGWGAENFPIPFDKYYNAKHFGSDTWYDRAHNVFLDYTASGGLLLLIAYLAMFAAALKIAAKTKELWPKITAVWLIMYLVQGMVLFDILPIYVQLFILLGFFIANTRIDTNMNTNRHKIDLRKFSNGIKLAAALVLISVFASSFYYGLNLPYKKNVAIIQSLNNTRVDISNWRKYFESSLNLYSPIGRQENVEVVFSFWNDLLASTLSQNQAVSPENAIEISSFVSGTYEKYERLFSNSRPLLFLGLINMRLALMSGNEEFVSRAESYCSKGNEIAPSRIEFLLCLKNAAEMKNDGETLSAINAKLNFLRPDLYHLNNPVGNDKNGG